MGTAPSTARAMADWAPIPAPGTGRNTPRAARRRHQAAPATTMYRAGSHPAPGAGWGVGRPDSPRRPRESATRSDRTAVPIAADRAARVCRTQADRDRPPTVEAGGSYRHAPRPTQANHGGPTARHRDRRFRRPLRQRSPRLLRNTAAHLAAIPCGCRVADRSAPHRAVERCLPRVPESAGRFPSGRRGPWGHRCARARVDGRTPVAVFRQFAAHGLEEDFLQPPRDRPDRAIADRAMIYGGDGRNLRAGAAKEEFGDAVEFAAVNLSLDHRNIEIMRQRDN